MMYEIEKQQRNGINVKHMTNPQRVSKYIGKEKDFNLDFTDINFPVSPSDIKIFEKKNDISINLYMVHESEDGIQKICIAQPSSLKKREKHINLLFLQETLNSIENESIASSTDINMTITKKRKANVLRNTYNYHYVYIKNLSRLIGHQVSKNRNKKYFCDICFHYLPSANALIEHERKCLNVNDCEIILPDPEDEEQWMLKFQNFHHKLSVPFVIYADFESILEPIKDDKRKENKHEPVSIGYFLKCR